jgi:hypothetical protein
MITLTEKENSFAGMLHHSGDVALTAVYDERILKLYAY